MKRIISAILAAVLLFGMVPMQLFAGTARAADADVWDGSVATGFARGDGSKETPYIIETAEQLAFLAQSVGGGSSYEGKRIHLVNNIDLSGLEWTQIGAFGGTAFAGEFYGNGHTIYNMTITSPQRSGGLFGNSCGVISDLDMENAKISVTLSSTASFAGYHCCFGALVGYNTGDVNNCDILSVTITLKNPADGVLSVGGLVGWNAGGYIKECIADVSITVSGGSTKYVGGLVGYGTQLQTVDYCAATGSVTTQDGVWLGGLMGFLDGGTVSGSYSHASVSGTASGGSVIAGGLVGMCEEYVGHCYAIGDVYAKAPSSAYAGGLIGYASGNGYCEIRNSYSGNGSVKSELSTVNENVDSHTGKLCAYASSDVTLISNYACSTTSASYTYYNTYVNDLGCNKTETIKENLTKESANCTVENGTFQYGTSILNKMGWSAYTATDKSMPWVETATDPELYVENTASLTVRYWHDGVIFNTAYKSVYNGESVSVTSPQVAGLVADQNVVQMALYGDEVVDINYSVQKHGVTVICQDPQGKQLKTYTEQWEEGAAYSVAVPEIPGYTREVTSVSGVMGSGGVTHTVICYPDTYTVTIHYRYEDGKTAAPDFTATRTYDQELSQESPVLLGYCTDAQNETVVVPAFSGDFETTVTYRAMDKKGYTIVTRQGGKPMAGVSVTFDGETRLTDSRGYATFTYTPGTESVMLQLECDGYANALYDSPREYFLKDEVGVDYFTMKIDTKDNPNYTVAGVSCYGKDISQDYGVINSHYNGDIQIVVKGKVPESDSITKMCLVQEVDEAVLEDGDNTVSGGSDNTVRKILATVNSWEEAMDGDGTCTFNMLGTQFSYSAFKDYPVYVYMYTAEGSEPVVQKLQINLIQLPLNFSLEGIFDKAELDLSGTGFSILDGVKLSFEMEDKFKSNFPVNFEVKNNEIYIAINMEDAFENEMKRLDAKGWNNVRDAEKRANQYFENMAKKLDDKFKNNKLFNTNTKASFALNTEVAGVIAITVYEDGNFKVQSSVKLAVEAKASWTTDFWVVFIPITVSVEIGGRGEVTIAGLGFDFSRQEILWPSVTMSMTASLKLSAGIGNRFASAGAFGRLSMGTTLVLGEETYFDALVLNGEAGFYAKLDLGLFSLYGEKAWKFLDKTIRFAPKSSVKSLDVPRKDGAIGLYEGLPVYDIANYGLDEVATAAEELPPIDSDWNLYNGNVGVEDVLDAASVKMAQYDSFYSMIFYFAKDPALDSANGKSLYYSLTSGNMSEWTPGIKLLEDVTADASYDVAVYDGKVYVALTQANRSFDPLQYASSEELILDMSLAQDLSVLMCDPQTATPQSETSIFTDITDQLGDLGDGYYDTMPALGVFGGRLYLSWVKNTATDASVTFCANQNNQVWMTSLCDGVWESPRKLMQGVYPIADMVITDISGTVGAAVLIDEDMNLYTEDDRNLYVANAAGKLSHVDCKGSAVSRLQAVTLYDIPTLLWKSGDAVMALNTPAGQPYQFSAEGVQVGDDYIVELLENGSYMITWLERNYYWDALDDDFTNVYCTYGSSNGEWTAPECVATVRKYIMSYDLDNSRIAFVTTHMETPEDTGEQNLRSYSKIGGCSLGFSMQKLTKLEESVQYDADGNVEIVVTLRNDGYDFISQVNVTFTNRYLEPTQEDDREFDDDWGHITLTSIYSDGLDDSVMPAVTEEEETIQAYIEHKDTYDLYKKYTVDLSPGEVVTLRKTLTEVTQLGDYYVTAKATSQFTTESGSLAGAAGVGGNSIVFRDLYPDFSVTGEYIIIEDTEYLSLRVENCGDLSANGALTVYRQDGVDENGQPLETKVCSYEIQSLLKKNVKYYLIKLEKDFFAATNDDFRCVVTCDNEQNKDNNEVLIMARKLEGQEGTQKDTLVEAPELSQYQQTFDKYEDQDILLDITLGEGVLGFYGCVDENKRNVDYSLVESGDGKLLSLTFPAASLREMETGYHKLKFYFGTTAGYVDASYILQIVDTTPIALDGTLEIVEEDSGDVIRLAERGMVLQPQLSMLNTDQVTLQWLVEDEVVSEEYNLQVTQAHLGKRIVLKVTGIAPYYGSISQAVTVKKLDRSLAQPSVTAEAEGKLVRFDSIFFVGDDSLEYGYATENDPAAAVWTAENEIVLSEFGTYYLFTRTTGSDVYVDAVSPGLEYVVECQHEMVNGLCCRCQLVTVNDVHYRTLTEALEVAGENCIRLNFAVTEDVAIQGDTWLDLNGCTLYGDVLIGNDATLYAFDSATSDYEAADRGFIRGQVIQMPGASYTDANGKTVTLEPGKLAVSMNTPADYGHNYRYIALREEENVYSFHRIYLRVESVVLQPCRETENATESLLNYRTVFKCNEILAPWIQEYGAAFTGDTTVYADHLADGYTLQAGKDARNSRITGLTATLSTANTTEQNIANSERNPAVTAYIRLTDGSLIASSAVQLSLHQVVAQAATRQDLTDLQRSALEMMHMVFPEVLDTWTDLDPEGI